LVSAVGRRHILAGLLAYLILVSILTQRMTVDVPLCQRHRGHFWKRTVLIWSAVVGWLVFGVLAFVLASALATGPDDGPIFGAICLVFGLGLIPVLVIITIAKRTVIRPREITDREITLVGVNDAFVDAMDDFREERRRKRDAEDGFDPPARPRRREADDHVDRPRDPYRKPRGDDRIRRDDD
jgi:hypothetical protein